MVQHKEHEKLEKQSDNFHLLMEFAEFVNNNELYPMSEADYEDAAFKFFGINKEEIKEERRQMEEQLKKQANER